ncbi:Processing peptidase [Planctomycetales bacterium 10988]|nr:Processing peptidase [Planctomycetales bacterium 10988]
MDNPIRSHQLSNGLTLLAESMPWMESAAFTLLLPCGSVYDPEDRAGLSGLVCEMSLRGCGPRDSREFVEDLDSLGVDRNENVDEAYTILNGAMLAENLPAALAIYADLVRRPHLPADQLEAGRRVMLQELHGLEDDPQSKVMLELKRRFYHSPWGRPSQGKGDDLKKMTIEHVQEHFEKTYTPQGTILAIAGKFDWEPLCEQVETLFGDWPGEALPPLPAQPPKPQTDHLQYDSNQTQIGLAYPTLPFSNPDYLKAAASVSILSGGSSSRLFTEVREKRGLCYSVYAGYHSLIDTAGILCYAGTSTDRAQETLDVMLSELARLQQGIDLSELTRMKARYKSALIMQQESSSSRSSFLAQEWFFRKKVRTLSEIQAQIDGLQLDVLNQYLAEHPAKDFTCFTLGAEPLEVSHAVL